MASETVKLNGKLEVNDSQSANIDLEENKKLRDSGLEYVSHTGKTIAAKVQPEELCNCPQRCGDKIPEEVRKHLFTKFYSMGDHIQQNSYLQKQIEMRSVHKRLWNDNEQRIDGRLQRRVSCKYHIPTEIPNDESNPADKSKSDDAHAATRKLSTKHKVNTVEVCQKAFMNTYAITEKRIRLQREKLITKSRKEAGIHIPNSKDQSQLWTHDLIAELGPLLMNREILANISSFENLSSLPSDVPTKILSAIDNDISIVNNFFCNQLWKPEYTNCNFDKSSFSFSENNDDYYKAIAFRNNKSNGDSPIVEANVSKNVITDKPTAASTPKYAATNNTTPKNISFTKVMKNISASTSIPSTPKSLKMDDSASKTPASSNSKSKSETKYLSFDNSSISITPVNNKSSNSSSSSIYNSINFGNSSISITPLYRQ